jgi:hypothetical protein
MARRCSLFVFAALIAIAIVRLDARRAPTAAPRANGIIRGRVELRQSSAEAAPRVSVADLGMGSIVRARWDEALPRFERVLSFHELEATSIYAAALSNTGICYSRLGDFERALSIQRRSVVLHTGKGTQLDFAKSLAGVGNHSFASHSGGVGRSSFFSARDVSAEGPSRGPPPGRTLAGIASRGTAHCHSSIHSRPVGVVHRASPFKPPCAIPVSCRYTSVEQAPRSI